MEPDEFACTMMACCMGADSVLAASRAPGGRPTRECDNCEHLRINKALSPPPEVSACGLDPYSLMPEHAALCLTGQLRSAPIAHHNVVRGPLSRLLTGAAIDTYVITSRSNSFVVWTDWLNNTLRPASVFVMSTGFDVRNTDAPWAHRMNGSRLQLMSSICVTFRIPV